MLCPKGHDGDVETCIPDGSADTLAAKGFQYSCLSSSTQPQADITMHLDRLILEQWLKYLVR